MPEVGHPDGGPTGNTDLFESINGPRFRYGVAIGGAVLAGIGMLLAATRGNVIAQLLHMRWGGLAFVGLIGVTLALSILRSLAEWRRRVAGRALLPVGIVAFGGFAFIHMTLIALPICIIALAVVALAGFEVRVMMIATVNVLVGCTLIHFALISLRDALLLAAAIRDSGSDPASLSTE